MQEIFTWYIFKPRSGIRMELYCDRQTFYAVEVMESDQFSYKTIDQIVLIVWHGHTFIQYRDGVHPRYIYRTISLKRKTDIIVIYGLPLLTGNLLDYNRLQCRLRIYIRCQMYKYRPKDKMYESWSVEKKRIENLCSY